MRWNRLAAALLVVVGSAACFAETPELSGNRPQPAQLFQGRLFGGQAFGGQGWWSRFGEPVNSAALAQAEASPSDKAAPMPMYGNDGGYVYSPGACDYSPPCIWNLWGGYFANPCRCHNHHHCLHKHCGCGAGGCNVCGDPCNACGGHHCKLFHKLWGNNCGCGVSCATATDCGCAAPSCAAPSCAAPSCAAPSCAAPSCSAAADCGCSKPLCGKCHHFHHCGKWRNMMAHWNCGCNSCSSPLSCGCTTPTPAEPSSEKQAAQSSSLIPFPVPPAL